MTDLSEKQQAVLGDEVLLVEACPGAGKTRAIVARFKQRAESSVKGLALLSFTNAAIDEASRRCSGEPSIVRSPQFVGTFDAFIHRYIVTPCFAAGHGKAPTYFPAWDDLSNDVSWIRVSAGTGVKLSRFTHTAAGDITLIPGSLPNLERAYFNSLSPGQQSQLIENASTRIQRLTDAGVYDSDAARHAALEMLNGSKGATILARLAARFDEVIVDEFQDCSTVEHALLGMLVDAGIRVVVVADPDQSIYSFRQAEPSTYASYRASVAPAAIVVLDENYRSSPVICTLVASLAESPTADVISCSDLGADVPEVVYLLVGQPASVREAFTKLCEASGIGSDDRIILGRSATGARRWAAGTEAEPTGEGFVKQIVIQVARLRVESRVATRRSAITRLEALLLMHFQWADADKRTNVTQRLVLLGRDRGWLRSVIGALVSCSEQWLSLDTCKASLKSTMLTHLSAESIPLVETFNSKLAFPAEVWDFWSNSVNLETAQTGERWATIHSAKGQEFGAVLLEAPDQAVIDDWTSGTASEERRVFYVGASRSQKLLAIAARPSRATSLKKAFEAMGIAVELDAPS